MSEVGVILLGLAVLGVIAKGLTPLSAGLAGVLRALLNPFVLLALGLFFVLVRSARRGRASTPHRRRESQRPGRRPPDSGR